MQVLLRGAKSCCGGHQRPRRLLSLTHVKGSLPTMVDVSDKLPSQRVATATGKVLLPSSVASILKFSNSTSTEEIMGKKGPVFSTAIVAGVLAVKKTADLIPFCHPIPIEKCDISICLKPHESTMKDFSHEVFIECVVSTFGKTGVEMEALVGVSNAALCVYDMLKAVSHDIQISDIMLVSKTGGKSGYVARQFQQPQE